MINSIIVILVLIQTRAGQTEKEGGGEHMYRKNHIIKAN